MAVQGRRRFLAEVGGGMLMAALGPSLTSELGLATVHAEESAGRLTFGDLEPLAGLMQETPPDQLLPILATKLKSGVELRTLVAAGALANARAFGGQDYIGYHTFMALGPAYAMSQQLESKDRALPVLKVLHRNSLRIQAAGVADEDHLDHLEAAALPAEQNTGEALLKSARSGDMPSTERMFAGMASGDLGEAYNHLQFLVEDEVDVHRVVLSWRAWESLELTGQQHAHTLLRQSVRYCVDVEQRLKSMGREPSKVRTVLPALLDQYKLVGASLGTRQAEDAWIDKMATLIANSKPEIAADAVAAALAEGFAPGDIGEALSLAANQLLLRDPGRPKEWSSAEKPEGSVHGDSVGVHASDAANAWRNIARVGDSRNRTASLIVGAFHTAGQNGRLNAAPFPSEDQQRSIADLKPESLVSALDAAIQAKDQMRACTLATRYGQLDLPPEAILKALLAYAVSQDGALHAEKYYRTVSEEFASTRPAFRWRHVAGLARVTASEFGRESAGYTLARQLV
jgi:hypothetical protein